MMKTIPASILSILFVICCAGPVSGEEIGTHRAYRVTSYNLGALADVQGSEGQQELRNFRPLLITSTATDILTSEHEKTISWIEPDGQSANTNTIALSAEFDATSKISLQGAFGVTRNLWTPDSADYENESSWEANLGIIYKLLGNLSYELHFGYMDTGDLFTDRSSYTNVESIIMVSNQLTMSF